MEYNTKTKEKIKLYLEKKGDKTFSLKELCDAILEGGRGKSTVFRIVSRMVKDGRLTRLTDVSSRHVTYQYIPDKECSEHLHLRCKDCGLLIHLDSKTSTELENRLMSAQGFMLDEGGMLYGRCRQCAYVIGGKGVSR